MIWLEERGLEGELRLLLALFALALLAELVSWVLEGQSA